MRHSVQSAPTPPETTFKLRPGHPFAREVRRILLEQVDRALWQLTTPHLPVDPAVHDARKCFKRIRGVLRLVRDDIGPERFSQLNALFRDAGRALSDIRTSAVLGETLTKVHERYPDQLSEDEASRLVARLQAHHAALRDDVLPQARLFEQVAAELQRGRALIEQLPLHGDYFPAAGMARVYARGRSGLKRCQKDPSVPNFHEWRKRVKYLRYHVRIFSPTWPPVLASVTEELVTLSELLGLDHDLADLHRTLTEHPELRLRGPEQGKTVRLIETYRKELEARSFSIGLRVYAEKPDDFVRRMRAYWRAWRDEWDDGR